MLLMFFGFIVLSCTTLFYIFKRILIGAVAAMSWIFMGAWDYSLGAAPDDIYRLSGIFFILVGMFYSWEVWCDINVERKAEAEETRGEDIDDLKDRLDNAMDNNDDKEMHKLQKQIDILEARDGQQVNVNFSEGLRRRLEERDLNQFEKTGKTRNRRGKF